MREVQNKGSFYGKAVGGPNAGREFAYFNRFMPIYERGWRELNPNRGPQPGNLVVQPICIGHYEWHEGAWLWSSAI